MFNSIHLKVLILWLLKLVSTYYIYYESKRFYKRLTYSHIIIVCYDIFSFTVYLIHSKHKIWNIYENITHNLFVIYWYWHEVDQNEYPTVFGCFQGYWQIDGLLVGGIESLSLKLCLVVIRLSFFMQYSIWCWHSWHLINNDSCFFQKQY